MLEIVMVHDLLAECDRAPGPYACALPVRTLAAFLDDRRDWVKWCGQDFADWMDAGRPLVKKPTLLLTCDDAYRSVETQLLPVLETHQAGAIVFVVNHCAGGGETVEAGLWRRLQYPGALMQSPWEKLPLGTDEEKLEAYRAIRDELKRLPRHKAAVLLGGVGDGGLAAAEGPYLDWAAIDRLKTSPWIEFGSHTATHPNLVVESSWTVWRELKKSRLALESRLGRPVRWLAYPYGSVCPRVMMLAWLAGYQGAFAARPLRWRQAWPASRYLIPRSEIGGDTSQ